MHLDPFLLHLASDLVNIVDLTCEIVGVLRIRRCSRTVQSTGCTPFGINVAFLEFR